MKPFNSKLLNGNVFSFSLYWLNPSREELNCCQYSDTYQSYELKYCLDCPILFIPKPSLCTSTPAPLGNHVKESTYTYIDTFLMGIHAFGLILMHIGIWGLRHYKVVLNKGCRACTVGRQSEGRLKHHC